MATTQLLAAYGFKCAAGASTATVDEARAAAAKLGYPVILKAIVANVAHRSDAGLVSGKISTDRELDQAYRALEGRAGSMSNSHFDISVEKFLPHDFEVILGVKYDVTFGPVILCGLGGIFTEVLKDYALGLAPLTRVDAESMLSSLRAYPILQKGGAENSRHLAALSDALLQLSELAVELDGRISAADINPIGLSTGSSDTHVLDAKVHF
jgi:acetyltransferase